MRKILLTARRWDLIFDVLLWNEPKNNHKTEYERKEEKKRTTHKHTGNFYLLIIIENTEVIRRREVK